MARKTTKRKKAQTSAQPAPKASRRGLLLYGGAGFLALGGAGTAFAVDFMAKLEEQDLSVIGNGTPALVQIHDPACPDCTLLQRATRRALRGIDGDALNYRVAYLNTEAGALFSGRQGLGRVTLAFFDGEGERVHVIQGVQTAEVIRERLSIFLGLPEA